MEWTVSLVIADSQPLESFIGFSVGIYGLTYTLITTGIRILLTAAQIAKVAQLMRFKWARQLGQSGQQ